MLLFLLSSIATTQQILRAYSDRSLSIDSSNCAQIDHCSEIDYDYLLLNSDCSHISVPFNISRPHYGVELYVDFLYFGEWSSDIVNISFDGVLVKTVNHSVEYVDWQMFSVAVTYSGKFCQGGITNGMEVQKAFGTHQAQQLTLSIDLVPHKSISLGIRNIQVNVLECHPSCQSCSGPLKSDCRICPTNAIRNKVTNECRCPYTVPFIYNSSCIFQCPVNALQVNGTCTADNRLSNVPIQPIAIYNGLPTNVTKLSSQYQIQLKSALQSHTQVRIRIALQAQFWGQSEFFSIMIEGVPMPAMVFNGVIFTNVNSQQSIQNQSAHIIMIEQLRQHNADDIQLTIQPNNYANSQAQWTVLNFSIDIVNCQLNCTQCSSLWVCSQCDSNTYLYRGTCVKSCPPVTKIQGRVCVDFTDSTRSQYLADMFQEGSIDYVMGMNNSFQLTSQRSAYQHGMYWNGTRIFGGFGVFQPILRLFASSLNPHYQVRVHADILYYDVEGTGKGGDLVRPGGGQFPPLPYSSSWQSVDYSIVHDGEKFEWMVYSAGPRLPYFTFGMKNIKVAVDFCYINCLKCSGPGITDCQLWNNDPYFINFKCALNNYYDDMNDRCQLCKPGCQQCSNYNTCTSCASGYVQSGFDCYCSIGYYQTIDHQCQKCYGSCNHCNGPLVTDCQDLITTLGCDAQKQCDDGNQIPRDGCTNCIIDQGWTCMNQPSKLSLCYKCGPHCTSCTQNECLQCSTGYQAMNGYCDPCPQDCLQCSQGVCTQCAVGVAPTCKSCSFGKTLQNGTCVSTCGDGLKSSSEECDDGNLLNGDGCDQNCKKEVPITCKLNQCSLDNTNVTLVYTNKTTKYDMQLLMSKDIIDCKQIVIKIDNFNSSDFTTNITQANLTCNIQLKYKKTITLKDKIHVLIYKLNNHTRRLQEDNQTIVATIVVDPRPQAYYSDSQLAAAESVKQLQNQMVTALYFLGPSTIFLGGFNFFFSIMDILAWLSNFYYMNIQYPINVQVLFQNPAWSSFNLFNYPSYMQLNQPGDPYYIQSPEKFDENGVDPLFINNTAQDFLIWFGCIILYPAAILGLYIIQRAYAQTSPQLQIKNRKQSAIFNMNGSLDLSDEQIRTTSSFKSLKKKYPTIVQYVFDECTEYSESFKAIFAKQLNLTYLDMSLASSLQLLYTSSLRFPIILFNVVLAALGFALCFATIIISVFVSQKNQLILECKSFETVYGTFYDGIDISVDLAKTYFTINLVRKMLFIVFMVVFYYQPLFQTALCCLACFLNVAVMLYSDPFKSKTDRYQLGIPDTCLFLIMVCCFIVALDDQLAYFTLDGRINLGWLIIAFITLSIGTQLLFLFKQLIQNMINNLKSVRDFLFK